MNKIPSVLGKFETQLLYAFISPVFFMFFASVYKPFRMEAALGPDEADFFKMVALMAVIILVTLAVFRGLFYFVNKSNKTNWLLFVAWCILEMTACTYLVALFLKLMNPDGPLYFEQLAYCLQYTFLILFYPYFAITTLSVLIQKSEDPLPSKNAAAIIHFSDSRKQEKFSIAKDAILYIGAEENYIRIYYRDGIQFKNYLLRASMLSIKSISEKYGLFRCHRSYYVNPTHIQALRRDKTDLITAELDVENISVPVSRIYYKELSKML